MSFINWKNSSKDLTHNQRDASGPSADPSTVRTLETHKQSLRKGGCQEAILKEGMNPPQSPDFNIIEAVWDHPDREQNKRQPTSKEEL